MVKYSKRRYNKSKRRYNKSKRRYNKSKRRYNKSKRKYNKSKRRYSKKNQRGGISLSRNTRSATPEIIIKEHRYTDLTSNTVRRMTPFMRKNPKLPYKFKVDYSINTGISGLSAVYAKDNGNKMFVIGVAESHDNGNTYNKKFVNREIVDALVANRVGDRNLYGAREGYTAVAIGEENILKIFFIQGFPPIYMQMNVNRGELMKLVDEFFPHELKGKIFCFYNKIMSDLWYMDHDLDSGNHTFIPVAINGHLIIDENMTMET